MLNLPSNVGINTIALYFRLMQGGEYVATTALKVAADEDRSLVNLTEESLANLVEQAKADIEKMFAGTIDPLVISNDGKPGPGGPVTAVPISVEEFHRLSDEKEAEEEEAREKFFEENGYYPDEGEEEE